ncbi:MAG: PilC/PilY family type IV pilus protein [Thiotrichaceae bacterium]|nr:PilC/PilY family type IV pilus protein [Thiotrichaceae bacterium]
MSRWKIFILAMGIGLLLGASPQSYADDTEIYLRQVGTVLGKESRPNILFILDRSGSMDWQDYYCAKPGTSSTSNCAVSVVPVDAQANGQGKTRITRLKEALLALLDEVHNVNVGLMSFQGSKNPGNNAINFPVAYIDDPVATIRGEDDKLTHLSVPISASTDDAEEGLTSKKMFYDDKNLEMTSYVEQGNVVETTLQNSNVRDVRREILGGGSESAGKIATAGVIGGDSVGDGIDGFRFPLTYIPKGSTILQANLIFTAYPDIDNGDVSVRIHGVAQKNPPMLTTSNNNDLTENWSTKTTKSVDWALSLWEAEKLYSSSDIKNIVQEMVDSSYWEGSGADTIALRAQRTPALTGYWTTAEKATAKIGRRFYTYTEDSTKAVRLYIRYKSPDTSTSGQTISRRVTTGTDDAIEYTGCVTTGGTGCPMGAVVTDNAELFLGRAPTGSVMMGLRFPELPIPQGATIDSATLKFSGIKTTNGTNALSLTVYAEDNSTADSFVGNTGAYDATATPVNYNLSTRTRVTDSVAWNSITPVSSTGTTMSSPDIKALVQAVVNRSDWRPTGNALALLLDRVSSTTGARNIATYKDDVTLAPLLTVTWKTGSGTGGSTTSTRVTENQLVGLRFQNVQVPQGATVKTARIDFIGGTASPSTSAALAVQTEAADDSAAFSDLAPLSTRSKGSALVWNITDPWLTGQTYSSPELKAQVQSVVSRAGWCGGNALSFIISSSSGTPLRTAKSFDSSSTLAPALYVEYDYNSIPTNTCVKQSFSTQVNASKDDAVETTVRAGITDNKVFTDGSALTLTTSGAAGQQTTRIAGMRFTDIPIRPNSNIAKATLNFYAVGAAPSALKEDTDAIAAPANLVVKGELNGNPISFNPDLAGDISSRKKTAGVTWTETAKWADKQLYKSVDITTVVQNLVTQADWAAFNSMVFFVEGTGLRQAMTFDNSPTYAPVLSVQVAGTLALRNSPGYYTSVRSRLQDIVNQMQVFGATPLVDTIFEASQYWRAQPVVYGINRNGDAGDLVSHMGSWTGTGVIDTPVGCTASNIWADICKTEKITGTATYAPPDSQQCAGNYIVFLTDGSANGATSSTKIKAAGMGISTCQAKLSDGSRAFDGDELCGTDVVKYLYNTDLSSVLDGKQNVVTHTIGFNLGTFYNQNGSVDTGKTTDNLHGLSYLQEWAKTGGGTFYSVSSASDLLNAFRTIVASTTTESTSFAAPSVSVSAFNKLFHNNEVYFALFKPARTQSWVGNIKKYKVCDGTTSGCTSGDIMDATGASAVKDKYISDTSTSFWSGTQDGNKVTLGGAGGKITNYSTRKLYTYIGNANVGSNNNIDFTQEPITVANTDVTKALLGDSSMTDTQRTDLINWMRGQDVKDENNDGSRTDTRWSFGDPLHSSPGVVSYGGTASAPISKLFVGANDGLIRMIDTTTGVEEWAFMPQEMLSLQSKMMTNINGKRIYGIDGTPTFWMHDVNKDGVINTSQGDFVRMYIGMRAGGKNIYAFDISSPTTPKLMWVINGGVTPFTGLAQTWSSPKPTNVTWGGALKTVLMFGGGFPGEDETLGTAVSGNSIFMVDATTGSLLWSAGSSGSSATLRLTGMDYPIPSDLTLIDRSGDGTTDRVYVGDLGGQVWRIDLDAGTPGTGVGGRLAALADSTVPESARQFFYPPEVVNVKDSLYSSVDNYDLVTIVSGKRTNPLNTTIHDQFYVLRDRAITGLQDGGSGNAKLDDPAKSPATNFYTLGLSDLYNATSNVIQQGSGTAQVQAMQELKDKKGLYIDLVETTGAFVGEKGLASPVIIDGKVFFTTFAPPQDVGNVSGCTVSGDGTSKLYALDMLTGGAAYNYSKSGNPDYTQADRSKLLRQGVSSDLVPMFLQGDGSSTGRIGLLSNSLDTLQDDLGVNLRLTPVFWLQD